MIVLILWYLLSVWEMNLRTHNISLHCSPSRLFKSLNFITIHISHPQGLNFPPPKVSLHLNWYWSLSISRVLSHHNLRYCLSVIIAKTSNETLTYHYCFIKLCSLSSLLLCKSLHIWISRTKINWCWTWIHFIPNWLILSWLFSLVHGRSNFFHFSFNLILIEFIFSLLIR